MTESATVPETILVIEDEDQVRKILVRLLEREGFRTIIARNGSEAIRLYAAHAKEITAVTMDLWMPETNGRDALAMLSEYAPLLPIVIVSAIPLASADLIGRAPGTPGIAFIQKPFTGEQLTSTLRRVMREMLGATAERRAPWTRKDDAS